MLSIVVAAFAVIALGIGEASAAQVTYYDVPHGAHPHDVAPAPDGTVWYTAQAQGAARHPRSEDRQDHGDSARAGCGAAWRHHRARPRRLDHRRRTERHRACRSGQQGGDAVSAAEGLRRRQSQHRHLRPQGHSLVHRAERRLWPCRSGDRQGRRLQGAEGRRALRHHHHAERRCLVRLARRRSHRQDRHGERRCADGRRRRSRASARAASGRIPKACCG